MSSSELDKDNQLVRKRGGYVSGLDWVRVMFKCSCPKCCTSPEKEFEVDSLIGEVLGNGLNNTKETKGSR